MGFPASASEIVGGIKVNRKSVTASVNMHINTAVAALPPKVR